MLLQLLWQGFTLIPEILRREYDMNNGLTGKRSGQRYGTKD